MLEIAIEIDPDDWDTLRNQTRTFEDLMAEIERYNLSRPFADIYTWFPAEVSIFGDSLSDVGVRKKGFLGSQSDTKPSLKIRFDKYVEGQYFIGTDRMSLNNSIQDPSFINTCLAYEIFAATGNPAPRCGFATVTVNGEDLGLYVHLEEIKEPFLGRHFDSAEGNLYEGTVSDFDPIYRGTFEKKTNEDEDDWSDVDAVMAALQDPSDAGLEALGEIVDLDRFLSFWATEVLVGHWDGYAGDRNNYQFYREPDGKFVFIPWGVDGTFHLKDDPNPFDNISNPPPSVLALTAIPSRLYHTPEWRTKYAERLKEILDTAWDEDALLASVDAMASLVQEHALPGEKAKAAEDTERVRKFILKRKGEILADITPEPPDWPEPDYGAGAADAVESFELRFETTWGTSGSANPLAEGAVYELTEDGEWVTATQGEAGATAGPASPQEEAEIGVEDAALLTVMGLYPDGAIRGVTFWMPIDRVAAGAELSIGADDGVGGAIWTIPAEGTAPEGFIPVTAGGIELTEGGTEAGSAIAGTIYARFDAPAGPAKIGSPEEPAEIDESASDVLTTGETGDMELHFETNWGSKEKPVIPLQGAVTYLDSEFLARLEYLTVTAGMATPEEQAVLPGVAETASITIWGLSEDFTRGLTIVLPLADLASGATLVIGEDDISSVVWSVTPGYSVPDLLVPVIQGRLELEAAGTEPDDLIWGRFYITGGGVGVTVGTVNTRGAVDIGLVINEIAAKGDPLRLVRAAQHAASPDRAVRHAGGRRSGRPQQAGGLPARHGNPAGRVPAVRGGFGQLGRLQAGRRRRVGHLAVGREAGGYGGLGRGGFRGGRELRPHTGRFGGVPDGKQPHSRSSEPAIKG